MSLTCLATPVKPELYRLIWYKHVVIVNDADSTGKTTVFPSVVFAEGFAPH